MPLIKTITSCLLLSLLAGCSYWHSALNHLPWGMTKNPNYPLQVTDKGVGNINEETVLERLSLIKALEDYHLDSQDQWRYGMEISAGNHLQSFYQLLSDKKQLKMVIYGENDRVNKIIVYSDVIPSEWGTKTGMKFSQLYHSAMGYCQWYQGVNEDDTVTAAQQIICRAPQAKQVYYVFSGTWSGPQTLLPDDKALADWKVSKIIWQTTSIE